MPNRFRPAPATPTTIEQILSSERGRRFFGDGPPTWRQGRNDQPAKTNETAIHERGLLVKALRRDGSAEALELAGRMDRCRRGRRCLSGACPACARATQRLFVRACRNLFDDHGQHMVVVNIVCHWAGIDRGRLAEHDDMFEATRGRLLDALADVAVRAGGRLRRVAKHRIASSEMLLDADPLPHLKCCQRRAAAGEVSYEADRHDDTR